MKREKERNNHTDARSEAQGEAQSLACRVLQKEMDRQGERVRQTDWTADSKGLQRCRGRKAALALGVGRTCWLQLLRRPAGNFCLSFGENHLHPPNKSHFKLT